ncbi:MAG: hypothetical protein ACRDRL_26725 [Sciscionella sp.]
MDERTVWRYVSHPGDLDAPIYSVHGHYGGCRPAFACRDAPPVVTDSEALADRLLAATHDDP